MRQLRGSRYQKRVYTTHTTGGGVGGWGGSNRSVSFRRGLKSSRSGAEEVRINDRSTMAAVAFAPADDGDEMGLDEFARNPYPCARGCGRFHRNYDSGNIHVAVV